MVPTICQDPKFTIGAMIMCKFSLGCPQIPFFPMSHIWAPGSERVKQKYENGKGLGDRFVIINKCGDS